jgi:hypothetical protein
MAARVLRRQVLRARRRQRRHDLILRGAGHAVSARVMVDAEANELSAETLINKHSKVRKGWTGKNGLALGRGRRQGIEVRAMEAESRTVCCRAGGSL